MTARHIPHPATEGGDRHTHCLCITDPRLTFGQEQFAADASYRALPRILLGIAGRVRLPGQVGNRDFQGSGEGQQLPPGKMASMSLPTPTLHTPRLRLRPFTDVDADALFDLHSSAHVLRYWDAPPWSERARAERFIAACQQMANEGTGARLAMDRLSDSAFIGWSSLTRWNPDYRSASLGYCLHDAAWGQGYATEAARALLQWAFDTLDLNRVQAETDTRNSASARVLEKIGFVREGTLREDCVVNGEVSNSWVYGLIRREWRPSSPAPRDDAWPTGAPFR